MPHTPGPWTQRQSHIYGPEPERLGICQVMYSGLRLDEDNARLIAAAPNLLEAAKAILAWALKNNRGHEGSELLEILSETQSAIAKAEGR